MSSRTSFSNGEAGEIVGVPASSIEQWCRAGLLRPQQHGRGRGHHRRFDSDDLVLMLIARELTRAGLSLPQLQQAFTVLRTKLEATRSAWRSAALFRDYSETIKLLARTFGRGNTDDVWFAKRPRSSRTWSALRRHACPEHRRTMPPASGMGANWSCS